jgi:ornithine decarboxylase
MNAKTLLSLAKKHGTPLFVVDHDELRKNYRLFRKHFPRVQIYYAVKVNSDPAIVKTFYELGGSFDVASMQEFHTVHDLLRKLPAKERQDFIWDKIIYANPIKPVETLHELDPYKPLVTYDNHEEVKKIAKHAPHAGLALRLRVPNTGSMVELSSKFGALPGEAVELIAYAHEHDLVVEGLSFHVGSQCTNPQNFIQSLHLCAGIFSEARSRGFHLKLLDIGGGFPAAYDESVPKFGTLARKINHEIDRLFPEDIEILAEPGRFLVGKRGLQDHRQGVSQRQALLLRRRRRLPHVFGHHLRPLHLPHEELQEGADADLRRLRPDLRRSRHDQPRGAVARTGVGRLPLQREHRRLLRRQ